MKLDGRIAIITGGGNGIGRATCELFASEGARVVVVDRNTAAAESVSGRILERGGEALPVQADVSAEADIAAVVKEAIARFGLPNTLVNCAGIALGGTVVETEPERWRRVLDVNLGGAYLTCRLVIPSMIEAGGGAIVNVASLQGLFGYSAWAAYAASKAGLIGLTRQIAVDFAQFGIRCNAISPGAILTRLGANTAALEPGFTREPVPDIDSAKTAAPPSPLLRPGRPEDVARAALFLASDDAVHITGHNLVVDGGASARVE